MKKCELCDKTNSKYWYYGIPGVTGCLCEHCALVQIKGILDDYNPTNTRISQEQYEITLNLYNKIKSENDGEI